MTAPMQRRRFLHLAGTTLAAATVLPRALAAEDGAPKKKRSIKKAIMGGTIGLKGSFLDQYRMLKEAGFEGVEPNSHENQSEVMAALEATGLKAASVCGKHHWAIPLSHPSENIREKGLEALKQSLRDAKAYGATSVLLVPGTARDGVSYEQCWQRSIEQIRKAIPLAEETGVKIAIENVWNDFITDHKEAIRYLDEINSPQVMWHFDIGNIIWFGDPVDWIKALGPRISRLHLKEYSRDLAMKKGRGAGFGVKFLEGANNWPAIMKALDDVGYQGWGITEQPGAQTKDADSLKEFSTRLDQVLAG